MNKWKRKLQEFPLCSWMGLSKVSAISADCLNWIGMLEEWEGDIFFCLTPLYVWGDHWALTHNSRLWNPDFPSWTTRSTLLSRVHLQISLLMTIFCKVWSLGGAFIEECSTMIILTIACVGKFKKACQCSRMGFVFHYRSEGWNFLNHLSFEGIHWGKSTRTGPNDHDHWSGQQQTPEGRYRLASMCAFSNTHT